MTNKPNAKQIAEVTELVRIHEMKRDELRKLASQHGIKGASKIKRDELERMLTELLTPKQSDKRQRTSHADCQHASTKVARAKCRRERSASVANAA